MTAGKTTLDLIRDILLAYIPSLKKERVNIYNQKFRIPDDPGLFVVIQYVGSKVFSNRSNFIFNSTFQEKIDLNVLESLSVNIVSQNLEALQTKELFVMALASYASETIQEKNSFKIFPIAPINDLSELEGSAQLFRFEIPIKLMAWYKNTTPAEYFDAFKYQVTANGNIEMETPVIEQPTVQPIL